MQDERIIYTAEPKSRCAMENYSQAADSMVKTQLVRRGIKDQRVLDAFRFVPRHLFVAPAQLENAYEDHPLPIGEEQTISQPYMVALMLEAMQLNGSEKVLEIGTGSGYMTALLCRLVASVYSMERIQSLADTARTRLTGLGYDNLTIRVADGTLGWPEESPFQAIVVSAGSPEIPRPLMEQLAEGGRLLIPVGGRDSQVLTKVVRVGDGFKKSNLTGCIFVKLTGDHGWKE